METATANHCGSGDSFDDFAQQVRGRVARLTAGGRPVFTSSATGLWEAYLAGFPEHERQHHNCHACRYFIERYGALRVIADDGSTEPLCWPGEGVPATYAEASSNMRALVMRAATTGVFLSELGAWGSDATPDTKRGIVWTHQLVTNPVPFARPLLTAGQAMAEKFEEHGMLCRGLAEFSADVAAQAVKLLRADALYRSEKCLGVAEWFAALHGQVDGTHRPARDNLIWLVVAKAPPGWCHVRSTMIGTLLEDIAAGMAFDDAARRFADKMHPLRYQRPQELPTEGQVAAAEKAMEQLGTAAALRRRFARLEDLRPLWTPREQVKPQRGGIFGDVRRRGEQPAASMVPPPINVTWEKFARTVLPDAASIDVLVPGHGGFVAFVTAEDTTAPPIMQWDREDDRNPVSWYVYYGGSPAGRWGLAGGSLVKATAISLMPHMWREEGLKHHGKMLAFVLSGARDTGYSNSGGLFVENLRAEYHAIRRPLEAYFLQAVIAGRDEATACGLAFSDGGQAVTVRVTDADGHAMQYRIDRWD